MKKLTQKLPMDLIFYAMIFGASIFAAKSFGAEAVAPQPYEMYYEDASGSRVETTKALIQAIKGDPIFKCQSVQASVSKSGTSIGLKNIKKPKVEK